MEIVRIRKQILDAMISHAQRDAPLECCGLLMGESETITRLREMENVLQSTVRYSMEPRELLRFFKDTRSLNLRHLGIYHSHPVSEAYPSSTDIEQSFYPNCTYFIITLKNPSAPIIRAFLISNLTVAERKIQVID